MATDFNENEQLALLKEVRRKFEIDRRDIIEAVKLGITLKQYRDRLKKEKKVKKDLKDLLK